MYPERADYDLAFQISIKLRDIGLSLQAVDILIASMCINRCLKLKTKDNDFNAVKQAFPEFDLQLLK
ncbi:type II toxin-antitoxin system VapC family toxin [Candidatus Woesearchaeota archaeon]|nr:type II toxin-antitoxin system VapC family toxin [Candidatus Woesearchaeota archaeon]